MLAVANENDDCAVPVEGKAMMSATVKCQDLFFIVWMAEAEVVVRSVLRDSTDSLAVRFAQNSEAQMRKLKIIEHISLDGVMQNSGEDGFPYPDWTAAYRTPAGREAITAAHGERFDLVLGRRTYDLWSGFWPKAPSSPIGDRLNAATKFIATHRPESLAWGPFEALGPDIVEGIRRIKSQDGPTLILSGSSTLTSAVLEHGLADEVVLAIYPVLLGTGKRFFAEGTPARAFELVSTQAMPSGIILNTYKLAGPLKKG